MNGGCSCAFFQEIPLLWTSSHSQLTFSRMVLVTVSVVKCTPCTRGFLTCQADSRNVSLQGRVIADSMGYVGGYADADGELTFVPCSNAKEDLPESRHGAGGRNNLGTRMVCGLASACQDGVSKETGGCWRTMKEAGGLWKRLEDYGGLWRTHLSALGLGIYCKVL